MAIFKDFGSVLLSLPAGGLLVLVFLLIIACDLASRPPTPSARPRRVYEALPDLRTVAAQQQTEQWTVADAGLAQLRAEQAGRRRGGAHGSQG